MLESGLYHDKMREMFGFPRTGPDSPVRNLRVSREVLELMEQDQLDAAHDTLDLEEEQVKLLKKLVKLAEKSSNGNNSGDSGLGIFGGLAAGAGGLAIFKKLFGKIGIPNMRLTMPNFSDIGRQVTTKLTSWSGKLVMGIGTVLTDSVSVVRGLSKSVTAGVGRFVGLMSGTILSSLGELTGSIGNLMKTGIGAVSKIAGKMLGPLFAAYQAYDLINSIPDTKEGLEKFMRERKAQADKFNSDYDAYNPSTIFKSMTGMEKSPADYLYEKMFGKDTPESRRDEAGRNFNSDQLKAYMQNKMKNKAMPTTSRNASAVATVVDDNNVTNKLLQEYNAETAKSGPVGRMVTSSPNINMTANDFISMFPVLKNVLGSSINALPSIGTANDMFKNLRTMSENTDDQVTELKAIRLSSAETADNTDDIKKKDEKSLFDKALTALGYDYKKIGDSSLAPMDANLSPEQKAGTKYDQQTAATPYPTEKKANQLMANPSIFDTFGQNQGLGNSTLPSGLTANDNKSNYQTLATKSRAGLGSAGLLDDNGRVTSTADTTLSPEARGFLDTAARWEGKNYGQMNGGEQITDFSDHPRRRGSGGTTTAAGRYQITKDTWDETVAKYNKAHPDSPVTDFSPASQDKIAWQLGQDRYRNYGLGNLSEDLKNGDYSKVKDLGGTWEAFTKKSDQEIQSEARSNIERNKGYVSNGGVTDTNKRFTNPDMLSGKQDLGSITMPNIGSEEQWGKDTIIDKDHPIWNSGQLHPSLLNAKNRLLGNRGDEHNADNQQMWAGTLYNANAAAIEAEKEGYAIDITSGNRKNVSDSHRHGQRGQIGDAIDFTVIDPKTGKRAPLDVQQRVMKSGIAAGATSFGVGTNNGAGHHLSYEKGEYGGPGSKMKSWGYDKGGKNLLNNGLRDWANKGEWETPQTVISTNDTAKVTATRTRAQMIREQYKKNPNRVQQNLEGFMPTSDSMGEANAAANKSAVEQMRQASMLSAQQRIYKDQGMGIAEGIMQAEKDSVVRPSFNPQAQTNTIMQQAEQPISGSDVSKSPAGSSSIPNKVSVNEVPHTDELQMMMANSQMMA